MNKQLVRFLVPVLFSLLSLVTSVSSALSPQRLNAAKLKATALASKEFTVDQLSFDFIASDGSFWHDCTHDKGLDTHMWVVKCDRFQFNLHLLLNQFVFAEEATFEFHYWADEVKSIHETHTQSTWITTDNKAYAKKIVSYLGFQKDATQLRIEVKLK